MIAELLFMTLWTLTASQSPCWAGPPSPPQKHLFVLGGGGDPPGDTTIFDTAIKNLAEKALSAGWKPTVIFDGGHKKTEAIVSSSFQIPPTSRKDFTATHYQGLIDQLEKDPGNQIRSGDQVMLVIDTHGSSKRSGVTHEISCDGGLCDTGQLKRAIDALTARGVKVALFDLSCYSGNTQPIANDKTCIVTSSSEQYVSTTGCAAQLIAKLASRSSLEKSFLAARPECLEYPQISGKKGEMLNVLFKDLLVAHTASRFRWLKGGNLPLKEELVHFNRCPSCLSQQVAATEKALQTLSQLKFIGDKTLETDSEFQEFKEAVRNYFASMKEATQLISRLDQLGGRMEQSPMVALWTEIAFSDTEKIRKEAKKQIDQLKASGRYGTFGWLWEKSLKRADQLDAMREGLQSNSDFKEMLGLKKQWNDFLSPERTTFTWLTGKLRTPLASAAKKVRDLEHDFYNRLYAELGNEEPNPCRDFIF